MNKVKGLTSIDYRLLTKDCKPLKVFRGKPYALLSPNFLVIKFFYHRGIWSSSTLSPYWKRFYFNTLRLRKLNLIVPQVQDIYSYSNQNCTILTYPIICGKSIREIITDGNYTILNKFAKFIAKLHYLGINFRDLTTDNIIVNNDSFALIDVQTIKLNTMPLKGKICAHNLARLFNNNEDSLIFKKYTVNRFLNEYLEACHLNPSEKNKLVKNLPKLIRQKHSIPL